MISQKQCGRLSCSTALEEATPCVASFIGHAVVEGFFNIEEKTGEMFDFALAYLKAPGAGKAAQGR